MPGMNGIDLLEIVIQKYPQTKVVMMTAFKKTELLKRLDSLGGIDFLAKPFGLNELADVLEFDQ